MPPKSNATATEDSVPIAWVFFNQSNPDDCIGPHSIKLPHSLFSGASQNCQSVFLHEIKENFEFESRESSITFWKPKETLLLETVWEEAWIVGIKNIRDCFELIPDPRSLASVLESEMDNNDVVHLAVTAERAWTLKRPRPEDDPSLRMREWEEKRARTSLPALKHLVSFIENPLSERDKIPIGPAMYSVLLSNAYNDSCTEEDLSILFRKVDYLFETELDTGLYNTVIRRPPPDGTDKSLFQYFWDNNIRCTLECFHFKGKSIRNRAETALLRPDFGFLFQKLCCFRGEEEAPDSRKSSRRKLADKLIWTYDPAPYVLGYCCKGAEMTIVAISRPPTPGSKPVVHDLAYADLGKRRDRIRNICHLMNLTTLFKPLADMVSALQPEFTPIEGGQATIEIAGNHIIKIYTCPNATEIINHLAKIYTSLTQFSIPHTDFMVYNKHDTVHLYPRGIPVKPQTPKELRQCLTCILETLQPLHKIPMYHRDIRWDNVMRDFTDEEKWFLIDWEDAAYPPTTAQPRFNEDTHSPRIFEDGHGAEVDIWGVGYLIWTSSAVEMLSKLWILGRRFCDESLALTAEDALELLNGCE